MSARRLLCSYGYALTALLRDEEHYGGAEMRSQHPHLQLLRTLPSARYSRKPLKNEVFAPSASRKATILDGASWVEKAVAIMGRVNVAIGPTPSQPDDAESAAH